MNSSPVTIYLDQLHWIGLAQAKKGKPVGMPYLPAYRFLTEQAERGKIFCPLSLTHYMELAATGSYRQRTDVATVMTELSGFRTISSTTTLKKAEIRQALNKYFGKPVAPIKPEPFGFGAFFAGNGEIKVAKLSGDQRAIDAFASTIGGSSKLKEWEHKITAYMEFNLLRGPHESQVQSLRDKYGYAPEASEEIGRRRAEQEEELAKQLLADPSQIKNLDNIVMARYLYWELSGQLTEVLIEVGMTMEDFIALGAEGITKFIRDIPTADILTTFTKANLKTLNRPWKKNDIHDMDALAIAIPYCDIVVTEKHAYTQLHNAGVEQRYDTVLLKSLEDLPNVLKDL
jgi:hypothetical protein